MYLEQIRTYCLSKPGVEEGTPFGPDNLVMKVMGKMFAIISVGLDEELRINLKCNPERAVELRERFPDQIVPGYHMNKQHWNTVKLETGLPMKLVSELIDHSYELIVQSLTKKLQAELEAIKNNA